MTHKTLNIINTRRLSQGSDSLDFLRVSFNTSVGHQKTQKLAGRDSKNTLRRVKHHFVDPEAIEGLLQICDQGFLLPGFYHYIIHISMNIAPNLIMKTILHAALISRLGTFEPKRHRYIAEGSKGSYKSCLLLVLNCHFDLMITRISIQKAQTLTTRHCVNDLINTRESEGISWTSLVQICVVHRHTPSAVLLKY